MTATDGSAAHTQAMDKEREFISKALHEDDLEAMRQTLSSLTDLDRRISQLIAESRGPAPA